MNDPIDNLKKRSKVSVKARLAELGVVLPEPISPAGSYCIATRSGNVLYISGHLPIKEDGSIAKGKVGKDVTTEEANSLAKRIGVSVSLEKKLNSHVIGVFLTLPLGEYSDVLLRTLDAHVVDDPG